MWHFGQLLDKSSLALLQYMQHTCLWYCAQFTWLTRIVVNPHKRTWKTSFTPNPRGSEPSKSAELSSNGVCVPHLRRPYDDLSTDCKSLKFGCLPWKAIWTEITSAVLRHERGQLVFDTGNRNQARGQWREWSNQRETLCLANFFLPLGKQSSSKSLPFKVTMIGGRSCLTPACHGDSYLILIGHYQPRCQARWLTREQNHGTCWVVVSFPRDQIPELWTCALSLGRKVFLFFQKGCLNVSKSGSKASAWGLINEWFNGSLYLGL